MNFNKEFIFGVATSAYQIEGGWNKGGRTPSIWDEFCRTSGKVHNNDNGDVACDHYNLYREDIKLMKELGVDSYRFSIAWPRIFPQKGIYNEEGMNFYKDILKELKENGIKAAVTLYHWDLPMWAQELGGWANRESIDWFLEYSKKCFKELDNEVYIWITHNEPWCISFLSNIIGEQAPGKNDITEALKVAHHVLLSHGEVVRLYRKIEGKHPIGLNLNLSPVYSKTDRYEDLLAANNYDVFFNRYFLDPVFKGRYPFELANLFHDKIEAFDFIKRGDFEIISEKCDFLSVNYYTRAFVEFDSNSPMLFKAAAPEYSVTAMGWEVYPRGLYDLIKRIRHDYTDLPIYIAENGCAYEDIVTQEGHIHDDDRIEYFKKHLQKVAELNNDGYNIAGYYAWSLMDNFEWANGYSKRFGLIYVDFESLKRIPKDSFDYYRSIIKAREI